MIDLREAYYALNCAFNIKGGETCSCGAELPAPIRECEPTENRAFFIYCCNCDSNWEFTVIDRSSKKYFIRTYQDAQKRWTATVPKWQAKDLMEKEPEL